METVTTISFIFYNTTCKFTQGEEKKTRASILTEKDMILVSEYEKSFNLLTSYVYVCLFLFSLLKCYLGMVNFG